MHYGWKQIEREQEDRATRNLRPLAIGWMAIGLVGSVVALLTGHPDKVVGSLGWFAIGLVWYLGSRQSGR